MYTPRYGDTMIMYRNGTFKACEWRQGTICGKCEDMWSLFGWDRNDTGLMEEIIQGKTKVGEWGTNVPAICGYYR